MVFIKPIYKKSIDLTRSIRKELIQVTYPLNCGASVLRHIAVASIRLRFGRIEFFRSLSDNPCFACAI